MALTKRLRKYYYRNKQNKQTKQTKQKRINKPRQAKTRKLRGGAFLSGLTKMMPSMPKVMPSMSTLSNIPMKGLTTLSNLSSSVSSVLSGNSPPPKTEISEIIRIIEEFDADVLQDDLGDEFIELGDEFIERKKEINSIMEYEKYYNAIGTAAATAQKNYNSLNDVLLCYMAIYHNIIDYKDKISQIIFDIIDDKLSYNKVLIYKPYLLNNYKKLPQKSEGEIQMQTKIQFTNYKCFYQIYYIYMPVIDKFIYRIEELTSMRLIANTHYIEHDEGLFSQYMNYGNAFKLKTDYTLEQDKTIPEDEKPISAKKRCLEQYNDDTSMRYCNEDMIEILNTKKIDNKQLFLNINSAISTIIDRKKPCVVFSVLRDGNYYLILQEALICINSIPEQKKVINLDDTLATEIRQEKLTNLDNLYNIINIILCLAYINSPPKKEKIQEELKVQNQILTQLKFTLDEITSKRNTFGQPISALTKDEMDKYIRTDSMTKVSFATCIEYPIREFDMYAHLAIDEENVEYFSVHRRYRLYTLLLNGAEKLIKYIESEATNGKKLSSAMNTILTEIKKIKDIVKHALDKEPVKAYDIIKQESTPVLNPAPVSKSEPLSNPAPVLKPVSESEPVSKSEPVLESVSNPESVLNPESTYNDPTGGKYLHRIMRKKYTKKRQMKRRKM
jgi:hypothetical protein